MKGADGEVTGTRILVTDRVLGHASAKFWLGE